MSKQLKLGWLFPDTLYLHGERGNVLALERAAKNAGLTLDVHKITLDQAFDPLDYDLLYCPAGELCRARAVVQALAPIKEKLEEFVKRGSVLLVTGTSLAFFGKRIKFTNGDIMYGLDLVDVFTYENKAVYGDDILMDAEYGGKSLTIFGNQIMTCDFKIRNEQEFGKLLYGYGSCGTNRLEGVIQNNSVFTSVLGPLLTLNPWLAEDMIAAAAKTAGVQAQEAGQPYTLEKKSLEAKTAYIKKKKTALTNCPPLK